MVHHGQHMLSAMIQHRHHHMFIKLMRLTEKSVIICIRCRPTTLGGGSDMSYECPPSREEAVSSPGSISRMMRGCETLNYHSK